MAQADRTLVNRREFVRHGAGLTICFSVAGLYSCEQDGSRSVDRPQASQFEANAWVNIAATGAVTIMAPADELGQGSMTALPLILAEELDVVWDDVRIEMSPSVDSIYGNPEFGGLIFTSASTAVEGYFDRLRHFGAQARQVLLWNAAKNWRVPINELTTEPSVVIHQASGRRMTYGQIAATARLPDSLPEITQSDLKSVANFRLIGHSVPRRDVPAKVLGTSAYSIDAQAPGMVFGAVARAPIRGAKLVSVDDAEAWKLAGVTHILHRESSVVIAADNYPSALAARRALKIEWSRVGEVDDFDSDVAMLEHRQLARDLGQTGDIWEQDGRIASVPAKGNKTYTREYRSDYVYHAQIEPLNATVWVGKGGRRVEAWVGTQAPTQTIRAIARTTGIEPDRVILHRSMVGGAFGRRSLQEMDFVVDAAWLSQQIERPVKMIWSREGDIAYGWFKPMSAHFVRATVDRVGDITAWHHRIAVQEPLTTAEPVMYEQFGRRPIISMNGAEQPIYHLPNRLVEHLPVETGIRTYALLGVGLTPNKFAVESFVDELAIAGNSDPLAFRMRLAARSERAQRVLSAVAEMSSWAQGPGEQDRGLGLAFVDYHGSLLAGVAEISVEPNQGKIRVHQFWAVIDPGIAIQPDNIKAQLQGAIIFGLGNALLERITFRNGVPQQSNFHDYSLMRMADVPRIHIEIMPSSAQPTAVGQTGAVLVAPAIANAFARLTGKRLRHMPFLDTRVLNALNG